uniref:Uncharacterized protein n=1 Tax=Arundo donax TaxID=35708 RepID=A0A0A9GZS0_ARUDO
MFFPHGNELALNSSLLVTIQLR